MSEVLLKNINHQVIEKIQEIATLNNRSLEEEIAEILVDFTAKMNKQEQFNQAWDRIDKLRQAHGDKIFSDSVELLREDRQRE